MLYYIIYIPLLLSGRQAGGVRGLGNFSGYGNDSHFAKLRKLSISKGLFNQKR